MAYAPVKRIYLVDDPFYDDGNDIREIWAKHAALDLSSDPVSNDAVLFYCNISGCPSSFASNLEFENHYNSVHRHVCGVCNRVFPSSRLVEVHILETHDTLFKAMAEKTKMYECLVEGCSRKFWNDHVRKLHLIDLHKYPKDFKFHLPKKKNKKKYADKKLQTSAKESKSVAPDNSDIGIDVVLMDLENVRMDMDTNDVDSKSQLTTKPKKPKRKPKPKSNTNTNTNTNNTIPNTSTSNSDSNSNSNPNPNPSSSNSTLHSDPNSNSNTISKSNSPTSHSNVNTNIDENNSTMETNTDHKQIMNDESSQTQTQSRFTYSYAIKTNDFHFGRRRGGRR